MGALPLAGVRVCLVTGSHIWRNPRTVKEAGALAAAGADVTIVAPSVDAADEAMDQALMAGAKWRRLAVPNLLARSRFERRLARLERLASIWAVSRLGLQLGSALGYGLRETIEAARSVDADVYSCHLEGGLLALPHLLRSGKPCTLDFEDWYSTDLSDAARRQRPLKLMRRLEALALQQCAFTLTTSEALADALSGAYGGKRPKVIVNAFDWGRSVERNPGVPTPPRLIWYSQTVGPNRGLEGLIDALGLVSGDFRLELRGHVSASYRAELLSRAAPAIREKIAFGALVPPPELPQVIAANDIGLALELTTPASRDLTITNKVFEFLQGGLAIVATRTAGQDEAAALFPAAIVLTDSEPAAMADVLDGLLKDSERLMAMKAAARQAGDGAASWRVVSQNLVKLYAGLLGQAA